jgi:hypothetical protein
MTDTVHFHRHPGEATTATFPHMIIGDTGTNDTTTLEEAFATIAIHMAIETMPDPILTRWLTIRTCPPTAGGTTTLTGLIM